MKEIIKIHSQQINNETINAVSGRDLHKALEIKTKFIDWIKRRLDDTLAIENEDYTLLKFENAENRAFQAIDYIISIDTAKEISMLERSQKGKEVRKYFIQCEKELKQQSKFTLPQSYKEALLELIRIEEEKEKLMIENQQKQETIKTQQEIIKDYDLISKARRSNQEMRSAFTKNVKSIAFYTNRPHQEIYNSIYQQFKLLHNFSYGTKINLDFISKNNDYLSEVLEISLSILNKFKNPFFVDNNYTDF